jgi:hypothetical protein
MCLHYVISVVIAVGAGKYENAELHVSRIALEDRGSGTFAGAS